MQTRTENDSMTLAGALDAALGHFAAGERWWPLLVLHGLDVSPCSELAAPGWTRTPAEVTP